MKKVLWLAIFLVLLCLSATSLADVIISETTFPDPVFRDYVINKINGGSTTLTDRTISTIKQINVAGTKENPGSIRSLQGIEYFTALKDLWCDYNQLTTVDVRSNKALEILDLDYNRTLTSLEVTLNSNLKCLYFCGSQLTAIDVSQNAALEKLYCSWSPITELNVSQNVQLRLLGAEGMKLSQLDLSKNINLTELDCDMNQLTSLDVTHNPSLQRLDCKKNQLTQLALQHNLSLSTLDCGENHMPTLDLRANSQLTQILPSPQSLGVYHGQRAGNQYILDMKTVVGAENIANVASVSTGRYDKETGIWSFDTLPTDVSYQYQTNQQSVLMTVTLSIVFRPEDTPFQLTAVKSVNGNEPTNQQVYRFELASGPNTPVMKQIQQNHNEAITFDSITFGSKDVGNTYQYTIREIPDEQPGVVFDPTTYTVTIQIEDNHDGTLQIIPTISNGTEKVEKIVFHNFTTGSIILRKTVTGASANSAETFSFLFRFCNELDQPLSESFSYAGSRSGSIASGGKIELADGQAVTISGLPTGTVCTLMEETDERYCTTVNGLLTNQILFTVQEASTEVHYRNSLKLTSFCITKKWEGSEGGTIELELFADGEKLTPQPAFSQNGNIFLCENLPEYNADGEPIIYTAKEKPVNGYVTIYQNRSPKEAETAFVYNGGIIINRKIPQTGDHSNPQMYLLLMILSFGGVILMKRIRRRS